MPQVHHVHAGDFATFTDVAGSHYRVSAADSATFYDVAAVKAGRHPAASSATFSSSAAAILLKYFGRLRRGDNVLLSFPVTAIPDYAPIVVVFDSNNVQVAAFSIPAADATRLMFRMPMLVGLSFGIGSYTVYFHYTVNGSSFLLQATFDVVAGGDSGGAVISLYSVDRPEARSVIAQLASGRLVVGGNPVVNE